MTASGREAPNPRGSAVFEPNGDAVHKLVVTLLNQHGAPKALKLAQFELRRARRARSRKQFAFWAAVRVELKSFQPGPHGRGAYEGQPNGCPVTT